MRNMKLSLLFAIAGAMFGPTPSVSAATQYTVSTTIKAVYPHTDGWFILTLASDVDSDGQVHCTNGTTPNKYYFFQPGQAQVIADGAKAMLATALAAFAMQSTVQVVFDDSTTSCYGIALWLGCGNGRPC